jgi:hypothetical protein
MGSTQPTHTNPMHSGHMKTWGLRGTLAAVGISAVVAGIGGAAIYAATDDGPHMMGMQGPPPHDRPSGPQGPAPMPGSEPRALHGEYVVSDGSGVLTTELSQTGRVIAISQSSVTVRSDDGFNQTYVIAALGPAANKAEPFVVNDDVTIRATRTGTVASVTTIDYARPGGDPMAPPPVAGQK